MKIFDIDTITDNILHAVVTIGMFDGVHIGHQAIIEELKEKALQNNTLPLVITFDNHPRIVLNNDSDHFHFLSTQNEKFALLEKYGIDNVLLIKFSPEFAKLSTSEFVQQYLIEKLKIKRIVLGYDNHFGSKKHADFDNIYHLSEKAGFFISTVGACSCEGITISSTQIRNRIESSDIDLANKMLGYNYSFSGKVVHGKKVGRKLGFPTANLELSEQKKALPEQGIYIVYAQLGNRCLQAVMSIGIRPTFEFGSEKTIEIHILNFAEDIYGQELTITFLEKIRDEQKFANIEDLIAQITADKTKAEEFFLKMEKAKE